MTLFAQEQEKVKILKYSQLKLKNILRVLSLYTC